jgi:hypothetical protein
LDRLPALGERRRKPISFYCGSALGTPAAPFAILGVTTQPGSEIMDQEAIDAVEIEWLCTHCFSQSKKTLGWLNENDHITCRCGSTYELNKQLVRDTIAQLRNVPAGVLIKPMG